MAYINQYAAFPLRTRKAKRLLAIEFLHLTMTEALEYDHIGFEVYCLEIYRQAKNLSGKDITTLFDKHGVFDFLEACGDTLHCLAPQNIIEDIDKFIENHPA